MTEQNNLTLDTSVHELEIHRQIYEKFGIAYDGPARQLEKDEKNFFIDALKEEVIEFMAAKTIEDEYDALIDLTAFVFAALIRMGLPFREGFIEVAKANFAKELAGSKEASKRAWELDLIKPYDWESADLSEIIKKAQGK